MNNPLKIFLILLGSTACLASACFGQVPEYNEDIQSQAERKIDKVYDSSGNIFSETNLFSDKNNGFYKTFHPNGKLATEIRYQDGWQVYDKAFDQEGRPLVRNGVFKTYYADGQVASVSQYRNDLKNGEEKYYYYDGKTVVDIWHYLNGRQVAEHIRNDSGGRFQFSESMGYPNYYVTDLQNKMILLGSILLLLLLYLGLNEKIICEK